MPDYRRYMVPGGTFFFTIVVDQRRRLFDSQVAVTLLGSVLRRCWLRWPFQLDAIVVLPDHLHTIWTLPAGDSQYSRRIGWMKKEFTSRWLQIGGDDHPVSSGRMLQRRRGVWQPRFWEHTIRDVDEFEAYLDYVHWNPVKHGHVHRVKDWAYSSFHRWVRRGVYQENWGGHSQSETRPPDTIQAIKEAGE